MAQEALITDYFYGDESERFNYFYGSVKIWFRQDLCAKLFAGSG